MFVNWYSLSRVLPTTVEIDGYIEQKLDLLVGVGLYATKSEAVRDAIRHLIQEVDLVSIAVELYSKGRVSLGFCAEVAELSTEELLVVLQRKGVRPSLGLEEMSQLEAEVGVVSATDSLLVEGSCLGIVTDSLGYSLLEGAHWRLLVAQAQLDELSFDLRRKILSRMGDPNSPFTLVTGAKGVEEFAAENSISHGEAASILSAIKAKAVLVADDQKVRTVATNSGLRVVSTPALIVYALGRGALTEDAALSSFEKLFSRGYYLPLSPTELSTKKLSVKILKG